MDEKKLEVLVLDRKKKLFEGEAYSVTSYNDKGVFDILPLHANFVSLIKNSIVIRGINEEKTLEIERGLMYVLADKVKVFVGI